MSPIEIRPIPNFKYKLGLLGVAATVGLYFFLGYLPTVLWLCGLTFVGILLYTAVRGESTDACVVLDDKGVLDKRLKLGVISWEDIRRITFYDLYNTYYVCLELHNPETYLARQPQWLKLALKSRRLLGMSPFSISTAGLQMDYKTLAGLIHEGCERAALQRTGVQS
jgi:hypothetical protein